MNIGIIGSGEVGRTLGAALLKEGHSVLLGTRHTNKKDVVEWKAANPAGKTGSFAEAAVAGSDLIIFCVSGIVAEEAIRLAGPSHFKGKTVIDTTNPTAAEPAVNGVLKFFTDMNDSLMEQIQRLLPEAHLVKAFNSVGSDFMYRPRFAAGKPTMFICGNNDAAKATVTQLLTVFGWETEDMGKAEAARAIEPLCMLWCIPGLLKNEWSHAFKLLKA